LLDADDQVNLIARVHDGLTWSSWFYTSDALVVDNLYPDILNLVLDTLFMSPSNETSVGVLDDVTMTFDVDEHYPEVVTVTVYNDANEFVTTFDTSLSDLDFSHVLNGFDMSLSDSPFSQVWDGFDLSGILSPEGVYRLGLV
jgi:hypothetical protein